MTGGRAPRVGRRRDLRQNRGWSPAAEGGRATPRLDRADRETREEEDSEEPVTGTLTVLLFSLAVAPQAARSQAGDGNRVTPELGTVPRVTGPADPAEP